MIILDYELRFRFRAYYNTSHVSTWQRLKINVQPILVVSFVPSKFRSHFSEIGRTKYITAIKSYKWEISWTFVYSTRHRVCENMKLRCIKKRAITYDSCKCHPEPEPRSLIMSCERLPFYTVTHAVSVSRSDKGFLLAVNRLRPSLIDSIREHYCVIPV